MRKSVFQFKYQDMSVYVFQNYIFEVTAEGVNKITFDEDVTTQELITESLRRVFKWMNITY